MKFCEDIFGDKPWIISGPCSAETEEQTLATARQLAANGIKVFRAGIWKPRTRPGNFEGVGEVGLDWLKEVKKETGMLTSTEVANAKHVWSAIKSGIDIIWIGARTTANPFMMQDIAESLKGCNIPVLVKNPVNPDVELWLGAIERLESVGLNKIGLIHRGFSSYEKLLYRNAPGWKIAMEIKRRRPDLPLFCDPSHIAGKREYLFELSQKALDLNLDGLMIESHINPEPSSNSPPPTSKRCSTNSLSAKWLPNKLRSIRSTNSATKSTRWTTNSSTSCASVWTSASKSANTRRPTI